MAKAHLLVAFALLFSSASASMSETADAAANALIVAASRDLAAADALDNGEIAELMERLRLIASARAAVSKTLKMHDTSSLAVRIALGEIPNLAPGSLDAALEQARISLVQGIMGCPDMRACLLNLVEGMAQEFDDPKDRSQAFSAIAIGLRDTARATALISIIQSQSTLSQSELDSQTAQLFSEIARLLARDGQIEMAISVIEDVPADKQSDALRAFGTSLVELGNFDAAARLAEHPSLVADDRDELVGDLMIFRAQIGDANGAVYWLERMGGAADHKRREAAEIAALSGDAALASIIISAMPAGGQKAIAEIREAGAARNVLRLKKFVDQVNALQYSPMKENLLTELAVQFYFVGDSTTGDQLSQVASSRDDVQKALVDTYLRSEQIASAIDAAEKFSSDGQRDAGIAAVAVEILRREGLAAAEQYIVNHASPIYSKVRIFDQLKSDGRLAEAVEYGEADPYLANRAIYLSAIDLDRHETLETALLRVLGINDPQTMIAALAALAYKFDR